RTATAGPDAEWPTVVLGLDTATWTAAVGVARAGAVLAEGVHRESRSHTASLPLLVERVLRDAGLVLEDVEGIAVSIGPGSFTGLRIGLALAKGLAFAGGLLPFATHHPRGGVSARLGAARLAAGEAANLGTLEPVYVRLPDAELPRSR